MCEWRLYRNRFASGLLRVSGDSQKQSQPCLSPSLFLTWTNKPRNLSVSVFLAIFTEKVKTNSCNDYVVGFPTKKKKYFRCSLNVVYQVLAPILIRQSNHTGKNGKDFNVKQLQLAQLCTMCLPRSMGIESCPVCIYWY